MRRGCWCGARCLGCQGTQTIKVSKVGGKSLSYNVFQMAGHDPFVGHKINSMETFLIKWKNKKRGEEECALLIIKVLCEVIYIYISHMCIDWVTKKMQSLIRIHILHFAICQDCSKCFEIIKSFNPYKVHIPINFIIEETEAQSRKSCPRIHS